MTSTPSIPDGGRGPAPTTDVPTARPAGAIVQGLMGLLSGQRPAQPAGDLPASVVTVEDSEAPGPLLPPDDRGDAPDSIPSGEPYQLIMPEYVTVQPRPQGRILVAEALAFVALTEAPFPRDVYVGMPLGAPHPSMPCTLTLATAAAAAGQVQVIAAAGQLNPGVDLFALAGQAGAGSGASITLPISGAWVRITAATTLHVVVTGY